MYEEVSSTIDAQSVAGDMFQANALTLKELQSIQSEHSKPVKAAEELLNIVIDQSGNVYSCFLDALKKTGHQRVYEIIVSGSCKGGYMYVNNIMVIRIIVKEMLNATFFSRKITLFTSTVNV